MYSQCLAYHRTRPRVLFVTFEGPTWENASHWSYTANLGFEEGLEANGIEYLTLIANPIYFEKKASWLDYARELCGGQKFDQAWVEINHSALDESFLDWLTAAAPLRVGFACESLEIGPEERSINPSGCQMRQDAFARHLKYFTHIVAVDEADVDRFNQSGPVPAMWWPGKVPKRNICQQPPPIQHNVAIFYGALYGDRKRWLESKELAGLLVRPSASLEHFTRYPKMFDDLQCRVHQVIESGRADRVALSSFLEQLRHIRRACFALWLDTLQMGCAVVNLPQAGRLYAGRVIEGMAAGRPVVAWEIPDRPRTKALFEDGKEILLYSDPEELAYHIRHLKGDPNFGREIAANARMKVESLHTTERFVREVFEWASERALTTRRVPTTRTGEQHGSAATNDDPQDASDAADDTLLQLPRGAWVGSTANVAGRARLWTEITALVIQSWLKMHCPVISQFTSTGYAILRGVKRSLLSFAHNDLAGFNQRQRDEWVASMASSLPPGTRLLDVGAGECRYRSLFAHCDYKAQDLAQYQGTPSGSLQESWQYGQLDYICDASSIPVEDGSFDAVLCTEVLEHVPEPIAVLKEIARIVRRGGRVFISAPLGSGLHQQPYHFYGGFTPHFYRRFLGEFGFGVISIAPNGRFFRMLLQEINRGVSIVQAHRRYSRWHPGRWLLRVVSSSLVAPWLTELDEIIPIDEFTVGYHVEAVKR